jgi:two-component system, OmpR family, response regulator
VILLVEDNTVIKQALAELLVQRGYEVRYAAEGGVALSEMLLRPFKAVVLDLVLPGMSGFDVLKRVAGWEPRRRPAVVVTTGLPQEDLAGLPSFPGLRVVQKPYTSEELVAEMDAAMMDRKDVDSRETSPGAAGPASPGGLVASAAVSSENPEGGEK